MKALTMHVDQTGLLTWAPWRLPSPPSVSTRNCNWGSEATRWLKWNSETLGQANATPPGWKSKENQSGGGESRVKGRKILNKAKHGEKQTLCGLLIVYTLVLVVSQDSLTLLTPDSWVLGCFLYFYLFKLLWVGFCYAQQKNITYYSWQ